MWTTPRTWVTGEIPSAATFNTHVRDNLNFFYTPPMCAARRTSNLALATGTDVGVGLDTEDYDTDAMHDNATNNSRLIAKTAGRFFFHGHVQFAANATGSRVLWFKKNGTGTLRGYVVETAPSASVQTRLVTMHTELLAVNDYYELLVHQTSGGSLNLDADATVPTPYFAAIFVGN